MTRRRLATLLAAFLVVAAAADADEAERFAASVGGGTIGLEFRYRYELVDQEPFSSDARASTLRSRLNYRTAEYRGLSAFVEFDDLSVIGGETYNDTHNGNTGRPVVADPAATEVNQAFVHYAGIPHTELTLGRQRINLDDERFVGGVGWRQNEQTFDAVRLDNTGLAGTRLTYIYVYNVNRVFGPEDGAQLGDWASDSHLINASYSAWPAGTLTGYAYLLDLQDAPGFSNRTFGLRFEGTQKMSDNASATYLAEYSSQSDYGDNTSDYDADRFLLVAGVEAGALQARLGFESFEGDAMRADARFLTPLATLHPFQGWADQFLVTPPGGIEDLWFHVGAKVRGFNLTAVYHQFGPRAGGADYGDELDLSIGRKFGKRYSALLKYASYDADNFATDTDKVWLMFGANFGG